MAAVVAAEEPTAALAALAATAAVMAVMVAGMRQLGSCRSTHRWDPNNNDCAHYNP